MANLLEGKDTGNKPPFDDAVGMRAAASQNADNVAKNMDQANQNVEKMGKETSDMIGEFTQHVADCGRENVRHGVHAMAAAQASLADMGYNNSRRFVETFANVMEVYWESFENAAKTC